MISTMDLWTFNSSGSHILLSLERVSHTESKLKGLFRSKFYPLSIFTCCLPCCPVASRSFQGNPGKQRFLGPAASLETVCGPCEEKAEGSVVCRDLQSLHLPVGSYLRWTHQHRSTRVDLQRLNYNPMY